MSPSDVVIVSAKRTPIGAFLGALSPLSAVQLGSAAIITALSPEPHILLIVVAGTPIGIPAPSAACRAGA